MPDKFTYTTVPNTLREFVKGIPDRSRPDRITDKYLKQIGFKEANDQTVIRVLKFIGFLDPSGAPTDAYSQYLNKDKGPGVMAEQLKRSYSALFNVYPNPQSQTDASLQNFFRESTGLGSKAVNFMTATFKTLSEYADFSASVGGSTTLNQQKRNDAGQNTTGTQIHLNIQIILPSNAQASEYETIFESMSKHLKKLV